MLQHIHTSIKILLPPEISNVDKAQLQTIIQLTTKAKITAKNTAGKNTIKNVR